MSRIVRITERRTVLRRTADDTDPVERIIVANADQLVIVTALADPEPRTRMIDRCVAAAYDARMDVLLALTKADLADPAELVAMYAPIGVDVVVTQTSGRRRRARHPRPRRPAGRAGRAHVGARRALRASASRRSSTRSCPTRCAPPGSSTTSRAAAGTRRRSAVALRVPGTTGPTWVIDTPGVRSFGLAHVDPQHLLGAFADLAQVAAECPRGCTHADDAPDCLLDEWVDGGRGRARRAPHAARGSSRSAACSPAGWATATGPDGGRSPTGHASTTSVGDMSLRPGYDDDLRLAHVMADQVDGLTMSRFKALDLRVETKPDLTPVSDADKAAEELIRGQLARARPRDAVHGEEGADTGHGPRRWVVDPIDGTKNFVRGVPVWATLIALMDGDEVVVGLVSAPALGRRWWAAKGAGRVDRQVARGRLAAAGLGGRPLADASLSYSSLSGWEEHGKLDGFLDLTRSVWRTRAYGDFWSHVLVAEGAVDLSAEPELELHDMAALVPIVTEAGGRFTSIRGVPGPLGGSALVTNGLLHDEALALLDPLPAL